MDQLDGGDLEKRRHFGVPVPSDNLKISKNTRLYWLAPCLVRSCFHVPLKA